MSLTRQHAETELTELLGRTCEQLVVVPAGQFVMGSPPGEPDRDDDEGPQHTVSISRPLRQLALMARSLPTT